MKNPGKGCRHVLAFMFVVAVISCCLAGAVMASSGEGHGEAGPKGWVATDTYRVMNFLVLAIGLFALLRKPVSRMLN